MIFFFFNWSVPLNLDTCTYLFHINNYIINFKCPRKYSIKCGEFEVPPQTVLIVCFKSNSSIPMVITSSLSINISANMLLM